MATNTLLNFELFRKYNDYRKRSYYTFYVFKDTITLPFWMTITELNIKTMYNVGQIIDDIYDQRSDSKMILTYNDYIDRFILANNLLAYDVMSHYLLYQLRHLPLRNDKLDDLKDIYICKSNATY